MAWIGLYRPSEEQLLSWRGNSRCMSSRSRTPIVAHQRPKLERYDDTLFVVLRPARYLDESREGGLRRAAVFVGQNFVVTVRHSEAPDLAVRRRWRHDPELLARGPRRSSTRSRRRRRRLPPVVAGLAERHRRDRGRGLPRRAPGSRAASTSCRGRSWSSSGPPGRSPASSGALIDCFEKRRRRGAARYLRDVHDHAAHSRGASRRLPRRCCKTSSACNATLGHAGAERGGAVQPERAGAEDLGLGRHPVRSDAHRHDLWHELQAMPELRWYYGYPFALALMAAVCATLYLAFKRRGWL